jgi:hypothetical protein
MGFTFKTESACWKIANILTNKARSLGFKCIVRYQFYDKKGTHTFFVNKGSDKDNTKDRPGIARINIHEEFTMADFDDLLDIPNMSVITNTAENSEDYDIAQRLINMLFHNGDDEIVTKKSLVQKRLISDDWEDEDEGLTFVDDEINDFVCTTPNAVIFPTIVVGKVVCSICGSPNIVLNIRPSSKAGEGYAYLKFHCTNGHKYTFQVVNAENSTIKRPNGIDYKFIQD